MTSDLIDLYHDERLDQSEVLGFTIPARSAKAYLLAEDVELEWRGRAFYIDELEDERVAERTTITVEANAIWYRLGDETYVGSLLLNAVTAAAGLATILDGSGWSVGSATSTDATTFSLEMQDQTLLAIIRGWAKITAKSVVWNTAERTVDLVDNRGIDRGLGFRYRRNVERIRRRRRPPAVTVLYPYGADGLSIAGVNGGVPYLEDFSFYTDQGITLTVARERYTRTRIWSDTSFVRDTDLLAAAEARLAALADGGVTYELGVVDLTELVPAESEAIRVGDTVRVQDPDFVADVRTTVVRVKRYPLDPKRNIVELAAIPNPLTDPTSAGSRPSSSQAWIMFTGPVSADFQIRNDGTFITNRIPLLFREGGRANFHLDLFATGVGAGTMTVEVLEAESSVVAFKTLSVPYTDGSTARATMSWATEELSGQYDWRVRVTTVADGGPDPAAGVDIALDFGAEASFWILAQGAVQQVPTLANTERFDYTGAVQTFTVPDNVTEVTIETVGSQGAGPTSGGFPQTGGLGGRITATFGVVPGAVYDVYVGGPGWPNGGGGDGTAIGNAGGPGGGASYVIPTGGAFTSAIVVAPGGGGAGFRYVGYGVDDGAGAGGLFTGGDGLHATGATQFLPGLGDTTGGASFGEDGDTDGLGFGGSAGDTTNSFAEPAGGGGGGWHGGGGAGQATGNGAGGGRGGGGGGSGWIAAGALDVIVADGSNGDGDGYVVFSWETPL